MNFLYPTLAILILASNQVNAMQNVQVATQNTSKIVSITALCSLIGGGIYYFVKLNKIRNAEKDLRHAAIYGDLEKVTAALAQGAHIDAYAIYYPHEYFTPLMFAIKFQHIPVIKYLLQKGASTWFDPKSLYPNIEKLVQETCNDEIITIFKEHKEHMPGQVAARYL